MFKFRWSPVLVVLVVAAQLLVGVRPAAATATLVDLDASTKTAASLRWSRLAVRDRTGTALLTGPSSPLAGLLSGGLQGARNAPLLVTPKDSVPSAIATELRRIKARKIVILGSTSVVSRAVASRLTRLGYRIQRIALAGPIPSSLAVARTLPAATTGFIVPLAATPAKTARASAPAIGAAAELRAPVFPTSRDGLTFAVRRYLRSSSIARLEVLGTTSQLPDRIRRQAAALGISTRRISASGPAGLATALIRTLWDPRVPGAVDCAVLEAVSAAGDWGSYASSALYSGRRNCPLLASETPATATQTANSDGAMTVQQVEGEEAPDCVIPAETMDYLRTLNESDPFLDEGSDARIVLGPFTDDCVEEEVGWEFGLTVTSDDVAAPPPNLTSGPELKTCARTGTSPQVPTNDVVTVTFDEALGNRAPTPEKVHLYRYDGTIFNAVRATVSGSSILAEFPAEQLQDATLCTVDAGVVVDHSGLANPEADVALSVHVRPSGRTAAPDVIGVSRSGVLRSAQERVDFQFDEPVDALDPLRFTLIAEDGRLVRSTSGAVQEADSTRVSVWMPPFSSEGTPPPVARAIVEEGAVCDLYAEMGAYCNPLQAVKVSSTGNSARPDLVSVVAQSSTTVAFTFDQAVAGTNSDNTTAPDAGAFGIFDLEGRWEVATSAIRSTENARVVLATFGAGAGAGPSNVPRTMGLGQAEPLEVQVHNAVGAFIFAGAASASESLSVRWNRDDSMPFGPARPIPGRTWQPDLVAVREFPHPVTANQVVRYTFDHSVSHLVTGDATHDLVCDDFHLYGPNAERYTPTGGCTAGGPSSSATIRLVSGDPHSVDVHGFTTDQANLALIGTVNDSRNEFSGTDHPGVLVRLSEGVEGVQH